MMKPRLTRIVTTLGLIAAFTVAADEPQSPAVLGIPVSGRVFSDIYFPTSNPGSSQYLQDSASLWLQGDPRLGENGAAHFVLAGDAIQNNNASAIGGTGSQFRVTLREGFVAYAKSGWDFRFGQQIIPWGKSDVINPTDLLTAKDYTFFNPDEEVRRVGAASLWVTWVPSQGNSPWAFTFVGTPVFPQTKLLIPPTVVPAGFTLNPTPSVPPQTVGNTETALKISYGASGWDASVIAFRGFNHTPEFAILGTTLNPATGLPSAFNVGQTFHNIRAAGADFSFTSGKWIYRGETAYTWTENNDGANPLIIPSHWDAVAGVERPIGDDFRIQGQFVYRYFPAFTPPNQAGGPDPITAQVDQAIAAANALLLAYQYQSRPGATFRIAYANDANGIDAEFFTLVNFAGGDYLLRPKFSYNWTDVLKTTVGLDYYAGPVDRPLGALYVFDAVFVEAKYTF
jgi:hypothetical protein